MNNNSKKMISARSVVSKIMSAVFATAGIFAVACVIYICINYLNATPKLTIDPAIPKARVMGLMDSVCKGDYTSAENYMLDHPDLGINKAPQDEVSALIWSAFVDSTSYSFSGECYTTDDGLAQNITFTCLDISSITSKLRDRSQALLKARVDAAEDTSEIYDENNEYRTDLVNEVLRQAVTDALEEDKQYLTSEITVYLKYQNDQWWVQADQVLLDALFGDVLFYS